MTMAVDDKYRYGEEWIKKSERYHPRKKKRRIKTHHFRHQLKRYRISYINEMPECSNDSRQMSAAIYTWTSYFCFDDIIDLKLPGN
jgi:hypothetical protein